MARKITWYEQDASVLNSLFSGVIEEALFVAFSDFCDINTLRVADLKLQK